MSFFLVVHQWDAFVNTEAGLINVEGPDEDQLLYQTGNRYVDDKQCGMCHGELYDSFKEVGMSQSFYKPGEQAYIEDFENNIYYHASSQRYYEMIKDDHLYFKRYQVDTQGDTTNEFTRKVDWIMGSGNKSRSYIYQTDNGELFLLPIAWYSDIDEWNMAPGFNSRNPVILNRQVKRECMFCHNAYPKELEGAHQYHWQQDVFSHDLPSGIGCQRCHGPGGQHIDNVIMSDNDLEKITGSIINPSKLSPQLRDDVCNQCHLQPTIVLMGLRRFDKADYSFKPGEKLSSYIVHFDVDEEDMPRDQRFEINHHAYRLYQSQCYTESFGKLGCISCHDPHVKIKEENKIEHFKTVCTSCHEPHQRFVNTGKFKNISMDDCTSCHMQQQRTQDVIHTFTTDHKISRPSHENLLAERTEKDHTVIKLDFLDQDSIPTGALGEAYRAVAAVRSFGAKNAVDYLAKILFANNTKEITPYFYLAKGQMGLKRYNEALKTIDKILKDQPQNGLATLWKGVCLISTGKKQESIDVFKSLTTVEPNNSAGHYNLGIAFEYNKQYNEAIKSFEKTISLNFEFASAHLHLGQCFRKINKTAQAKEAFINSLKIEPTLDRAYAQMGSILMEELDKEKAITTWSRGLQFARNKNTIKKAAQQYDIEIE